MEPFALYSWLVKAPGEPGGWSQILAATPQTGPVVLTVRSESLALAFQQIAEAHGRKQGQPVRLVKFEAVEDLIS